MIEMPSPRNWRHPPPSTRYRMMFMGEWRPVLRMIDARGVPTTLPMRAVRAVLYIDDVVPANCGWVVADDIMPADVLENPDYVTTKWEDREVVR